MMKTDIKILVVDDQPAVRKVLCRILKQLGFNLLAEAGNGKSAWAILETQQIDLVIADWVMPEMTGLELLLKIRSSKAHKPRGEGCFLGLSENTIRCSHDY